MMNKRLANSHTKLQKNQDAWNNRKTDSKKDIQ